MELHNNDILQLFENKFPLVKLQSCHFKMDNIIGSDEFYKGDNFRIIEIDGQDIFLSRNNSIYFIKEKDLYEIFINLTQQRKDKLKKLFDV